MKKRFFLTLIFCLIFTMAIAGTTSAAPAAKVDVCHYDADSGTFHLINISENAFQAHIDHGDGGPGDDVPGNPTKMFAADCALLDKNANVAGTWWGQSGYENTMGYWFYMYLSQDSAGNVTGTINYYDSVGIRTVTGTVSGNLFTFTTVGGSYWADCTPCTVSLDGSYFNGTGTHSSNTTEVIEFEAWKQ